MKKLCSLLIALTLSISATAFAETKPPSPESLQKLFEVTDAESMFSKVQSQLETMVDNMLATTVDDNPVTPEQKKAIDKFHAKIIRIQKEEFHWKTIQSKISEIYRKSLSQEDVDGVIAFYQSPAGQAYLKKMPTIMQQTMVTLQEMVAPMMKKLAAAEEELKEELQKAEKK